MMRKALLGLPPAVRIAAYIASTSNVGWYGTRLIPLAEATKSVAGYATIHSDDSSRIWSNNELKDMPRHAQPSDTAAAVSRPSTDKDYEDLKDHLLGYIDKQPSSMEKKKKRREQVTKLLADIDTLHASDVARISGVIRSVCDQVIRSNNFSIVWNSVERLTKFVSIKHSNSPDRVVLDLEHHWKTLPIPTIEQYSQAPQSLFKPPTISQEIHNRAQAGKIELNISSEYDERSDLPKIALDELTLGSSSVYWRCKLTVEIGDLCLEHGVGEGVSKTAAKQAAWLHILSKLHENGSLKVLYPTDETQRPAEQTELDVDPVPESIETVALDEQTRAEQKNAKAEIYECSALHGLIPDFEYTEAQPTRLQGRMGRRQPLPKDRTLVTITLLEWDIKVKAVGKDRSTAETAAAIAFKRDFAKKHDARRQGAATARSRLQYGVLNSETSQEFVEHYRNSAANINVELEQEKRSEFGDCYYVARVLINGEIVGKAVSMSTKKDAQTFAYLTAAIALVVEDLNLLDSYLEAKQRVSGKRLLKPIGTIDLAMDHDTLETMRKALIEARDAGIPDAKQILEAQVIDDFIYRHRRHRSLSSQDQSALNTRLLGEQELFAQDSGLAELQAKQVALPMNAYRQDVLDIVNNNQYSIIVGATGSGKTTQVPQILLDHAISRSEAATTNILCTQPRRIAARSVAQRVAIERSEPLQHSTGYHVRGDVKLPRLGASMTFCTTGILLEQLKFDVDGVFDNVSHILVDEVHDRDLPIDFLMTVLKKAVAAREAAGRPVPKVVLMSATIDADLFAQYFTDLDANGIARACPILKVPGRTFPVQESYLDEIFGAMKKDHPVEFDKLLENDKKTVDYLEAEVAFTKTVIEQGNEPSGDIDWKRKPNASGDDATIERIDAIVPVPLIAATVSHLCNTTSDGAILVFVPGMDEILGTQRVMSLPDGLLGNNFNDPSKFKICVLHSTVSKESQNEIFQPVPPGCRKIILSTNIAETSVTVPDVKYVVDSGKLRELRYDHLRRITGLQTVWESKSNAKQRAGRAGRVQNGFYYGLFSKERARSLRAVGLPELLRTDLQETCLSVKAQRYEGTVEAFLSAAIEPPPVSAVSAAVAHLKSMEAFTEQEEITALGGVLSRLPLHPALGKMIILGIIFRCLDPMLVLGAAAEERSIWVTPITMREQARQAHATYGDQQSDQLAILEAFKELRALRDELGDRAVHQRASEKFLHVGAFRSIDATARQIDEILAKSGLTPFTPPHDRKVHQYGHPDLNRNSQNAALITGILLAGHYPNIAVKRSTTGPLYRTPDEGSVLMHPSTRNNDHKKKNDKNERSSLYVFRTLQKSLDGSTLFLVDTSKVDPLVSLLFGGTIKLTEGNRLEKDGWLPFFVKADNHSHAAKVILEFRKLIDRLFNSAFQDLAKVNSGGTYLADDPARETLAQRVVAILSKLNQSPDQHSSMTQWWK